MDSALDFFQEIVTTYLKKTIRKAKYFIRRTTSHLKDGAEPAARTSCMSTSASEQFPAYS
jgi:hypothetical protein